MKGEILESTFRVSNMDLEEDNILRELWNGLSSNTQRGEKKNIYIYNDLE